MKKICEKVLGWFRGIGIDKYWHFIAGMIVAAFFAMVVELEVCILPVLAVGFIKEAVDFIRSYHFNWWDFAATLLGGGIIQLFVYL